SGHERRAKYCRCDNFAFRNGQVEMRRRTSFTATGVDGCGASPSFRRPALARFGRELKRELKVGASARMAMFDWYREADKKTRRIFWTCCAGWVLDMADGVVCLYLISVLVTALGMTLIEAGFISIVNFFAAAFGGWVGGWLCDRYGRARILQLTILWF